jgi:hypothetical protein
MWMCGGVEAQLQSSVTSVIYKDELQSQDTLLRGKKRGIHWTESWVGAVARRKILTRRESKYSVTYSLQLVGC